MRALVIKSPWIEKILAGEKTWEIRSSAIHIREAIGLIKGGSGTVVGVCLLVDSRPLTKRQFQATYSQHRVPASVMDEFGYEDIHAWVLERATALVPPVPYEHPRGAVNWVTLDGMPAAATVAKAARRL